MRTHFHAGWNMPGYLPEAPYETFDSMEDARAFLRDELLANGPEDADTEFAYDGGKRARQWHRGLAQFDTTAPWHAISADYDGYVYVAEECDGACESTSENDAS